MSEPQDNPRSSPEGENAAAPSPPVGSAANYPVEPVADAPTVISRPANRSPRPEDSFAYALRGRRLAHFDLAEPIGVGGMAAVIRATDTQLDRVVALKILPPEMASDPENIRRFQQEARSAARLDHENIARAFYFGEDQGLHFIAFEFVEGENLRTILEQQNRIPVADAVHYMLQITRGLKHAAERGVVHRDIKPSNIIIGPDHKAKLVDMGLARNLHPLSDGQLTQSGVTLGTFDYISPEQALEPRKADVRSDIYSLGCTFYQVLTGQSPVPEGTAAKKLHHHQHVAPLDPRQLNPEIPDDLAAILARMMAKDPIDRYQKPEQLEQHLLQLAQQIDPRVEVPANLRLVHAPLPTPPRMRLLPAVAASALLLVTLVILHGLSGGPKSGDWIAPADTKIDDPSEKTPQGSGNNGTAGTTESPRPPTPPPAPVRVRHEVQTAKELTAILEKKHARADVFLVQDIDLKPEAGEAQRRVPGLVFEGFGRELTIQPKNPDPNKRPTLRLAYDADLRDEDGEGFPVWTALTLKGGKVTLRGLRFEINAKQAPRIIMAAVKLQEGGQLHLENCEFVQYDPPGEEGRLSDVVVEGARTAGPKAIVSASDCYFVGGKKAEAPANTTALGGRDALTLTGAVSLQLIHCAFGPHAALVHLQDKSTKADVTFSNCSALLADGTTFRMDDDASCRLVVQNSLFSRPNEAAPASADGAVLIRQSGQGNIQFIGSCNRYHNLGAFWVGNQEGDAEAWGEFQRAALVNDENSNLLSASPWVEKDPLLFLKKNQPKQAFLLDVQSPELRQIDNKNRMVGVEHCTWGESYGKLPPLDDRKPELLAQKIVDPSQETGGGFYNKLSEAILDAKASDVILIKHNGILPLEPIRLEKAGLDLTIRAFPSYRPILMLGEAHDKDASLFRLPNGALKLENLEFLLKPRQRDFKNQALVNLEDLGQCAFKNCVVTLDAGFVEDASLSVAALVDSRDLLKLGPPLPQKMPKLHFENCFVRGKGSLASIRTGRPFELKAENCLTVLDGSLLNLDGNPEQLETNPVKLSLSRVTAYLTKNLAYVKVGKNAIDLMPLQFKTSDCLFVSANEQTLIRFAGEITDEQLKEVLTWEGNHNAYSNFKQMIDQQPLEDEFLLAPYGREKWEILTRERDGAFDRVKFSALPLDPVLSKTVPAHFKAKSDADADTGYGADVDGLPRPSLDRRAAFSVQNQKW